MFRGRTDPQLLLRCLSLRSRWCPVSSLLSRVSILLLELHSRAWDPSTHNTLPQLRVPVNQIIYTSHSNTDVHTTVQAFGVGKILKRSHQSCIYLIKNTVQNCEKNLQSKIVVFYVNICWNVIYFCDQSWIFSIISPVFADFYRYR